MESVVAALVTGVLALAGVLTSNSRSRAIIGAGRRRREGGDREHAEGAMMEGLLTSKELP